MKPFNFKKDINSFKDFFKILRERAPLFASTIQVIFVFLKWLFILIILMVIAMIILTHLLPSKVTQKDNLYNQEKCNFAIEDVRTYFNEFDNPYTVSWNFEGLIRNNSKNNNWLKAMIVKLYNEKGVLIGEGYTEIGKTLNDGSLIPFKVNVQVSRHDTEKWHYYKESKEFKPDIYPWFITCK